MARLYTNENFPLPAAEYLRKLGHDVTTLLDDGRPNQGVPDQEVLARATALSRAVVTLNRSCFVRLHRQSAEHSGVIVCTADEPVRLAERIHAAISEHRDLNGQLIRAFKPS